MIKLAKLNIDLYSDQFQEDLHKIAEALPDFVKDTNFLDKEQLDMLSDGDFALIISTRDGELLRLFPTLDKGHTWMAAYYFLKNKEKLPKDAQVIAATNIKKALNYWEVPCPDGIEELNEEVDHHLTTRKYKELENENIPSLEEAATYPRSKEAGAVKRHYYEKIIDQEKIAFQVSQESDRESEVGMTDADYAMVIKTAGSTERYLPIKTAEQLHQSCSDFSKQQDDIDPRYRQKISWALAKRSEELGLAKIASPVYNENLEHFMDLRKELVPEGFNRCVLDMMIEKKASFTPREFAEKLAMFDEANNLERFWNRSIPDPYKSTVDFEKKAFINGFDITEDDLINLAQNPKGLQGILEPAMITDFVSNPVEFFDALPKPHQQIIAGIIRGRA